MKYHAVRALTGQWLYRDLPLTDVSRSKVLSGAGQITATVPQELTAVKADDDRPLFQDWSTIILAEDDNGAISHHGIMQPQTQYQINNGAITCSGVSSYAHGYIYLSERNWGPDSTLGRPRPDTITIVRDLWAYLQAQQDSNLGVTLTGATKSGVPIGDNEEPYRLRWWETPDIGEEIDKLVAFTPFDFEESVYWYNTAKTSIRFNINIGHPRLGKGRHDLLFADGVNIVEAVPLVTAETRANHIVGIGNGEGSTLVHAEAVKSDGRLRRHKVLTDATATKTYMNSRVQTYLERLNAGLDITSLTIRDSDYARITDIRLGDDIRVQTFLPSFGKVDMWLRVLGMTETDNSDRVVLTTSASAFFLFSATEELK